MLGVTVGVGVGIDVGEIDDIPLVTVLGVLRPTVRFAVLTLALAIALGLPVTVKVALYLIGAGPVECIETREEVMLYDKRIPTASTANIAITKSTLRQILPGGSDG